MLVTVADKQLQRLEYNNQPVVTVKQIAEVHGISEVTVRSAYSRYKQHFKQGTDVSMMPAMQVASFGCGYPRRSMLAFTEAGYLKLAKTFTDLLSWQIQGQLVSGTDFLVLTYREGKPEHLGEKKALYELCLTTWQDNPAGRQTFQLSWQEIPFKLELSSKIN